MIAPIRDTHYVREALLSAGRAVLGQGGVYTGRIVVKVSAPDDGLSVSVAPVVGADGLVTAPPVSPADARSARLREHFVSQSERLILRDLLAHQPCRAADVAFRVKVEKSKFWVLWSNLQHRGMVEDDDEKGFRAAEWVREFVGD